MFERYPYANVYAKRAPGQVAALGQAQICEPPTNQNGPIVVNFMAQKHPGGPYRIGDDVYQRQRWFQQCLDNLKTHAFANDDTKVIAFPHRIGCGLAKGNWAQHLAKINDFAHNIPARVLVCKLPQ